MMSMIPDWDSIWRILLLSGGMAVILPCGIAFYRLARGPNAD